jgi:hypothetical protein
LSKPHAEELSGKHLGEIDLRSAAGSLSRVVVPTTLLTALLFNFGWVFTNSWSLYLGIDPSILGFSTQDYLLRSIVPIFSPLSALLFLVLTYVWIDRRVSHWIEAGSHELILAFISRTFTAVGLLLAVIGVGGAISLIGINFLLPLALALGSPIFMYGLHLRRRIRDRVAGRRSAPRRHSAVVLAIVAIFVTLGIFGFCDDWAQFIGRIEAQQFLAERPHVVVFSERQLLIDGPGVSVTKVGGTDAAYQFRYSGLLLLQRANANYILFPARWSHSKDSALVLPNNDTLRLEFRAP